MSKILLDVDGVVCDLIGDTLRHVNQIVSPERVELTDITEWDTNACINRKLKFLGIQSVDVAPIITDLWNRQDFVRGLTPIDGAVDAVTSIRGIGHRVVFLTAGRYQSRYWFSERHEWLRYWFDAQESEIIFASSKYFVKGDIFIDDKPGNVAAWQRENPDKEAWLLTQPWNHGTDLNGINHVSSLLKIHGEK